MVNRPQPLILFADHDSARVRDVLFAETRPRLTGYGHESTAFTCDSGCRVTDNKGCGSKLSTDGSAPCLRPAGHAVRTPLGGRVSRHVIADRTMAANRAPRHAARYV